MLLWMCEEGEGDEAEGAAKWGSVAETTGDDGAAATTANAAAASRVWLGLSPTATKRVEWSSTAAHAAIILQRGGAAIPTTLATTSSAARRGHHRLTTANDAECAWDAVRVFGACWIGICGSCAACVSDGRYYAGGVGEVCVGLLTVSNLAVGG